MEQHRIPIKVLERRPVGRRSRGWPKKRWSEDVVEDLRDMVIRRLKRLCNERAERRKIVEEAKTHTEL